MYDKSKSEIVLIFQTVDNELSDKFIRKELSKFIPKYMIPTRFVFIKDWPLNSNGKIDRKKLLDNFLS